MVQHLRLGDCVTLISGGTPSKARNEYWGGEIPWVSCKDMKVDRIYDAEDHLTPLGAQNGTRVVSENTILVVVRGMILAREFPVAMTKRPVAFNQDLKAVKPADFIDNEYLFHWFRANAYEIVGRADEAGHGTKRVQTDRLLSMPIFVPSLAKQRRIARVLSAYDELIENSRRRIRILEEMARALYREWFVEFGFPGHAKVPRVASELGEVPKGWEVKPLSAIADVNRTQINARNAPDEVHYIDIASVSPGQIDAVTTYLFSEAPGRARRIVQHGDLLWSCVRPNRRSHALVMFPRPDTIASTGFAVLTAKAVPYTFLYAATTTDDFVGYLTNNASGAAYPAVTASTFAKAMLPIPPQSLLKRFGELTVPMAEEAHLLRLQIANLRATRDLLLPRFLKSPQVARA
jgi:type I restriction enzyme S subunit